MTLPELDSDSESWISRFRLSTSWREALIAIIGTVTAFVLGYVYAVAHPYDGTRWSSAQLFMTPAVNYACTDHFGPLRLTPDATPADTDAITAIETFFVSKPLTRLFNDMVGTDQPLRNHPCGPLGHQPLERALRRLALGIERGGPPASIRHSSPNVAQGCSPPRSRERKNTAADGSGRQKAKKLSVP
jgi:hypothetical protein